MTDVLVQTWILVLESLRSLAHMVGVHAPRVMAFVVVVVTARFVALLLRKVLVLGLRFVGFDVALRRFSIGQAMLEGRLSPRPSGVVGAIAYWAVILVALIAVFHVLGMTAAYRLLVEVIGHIPYVLVAVLLMALGLHLAGFFGSLVEDAALAAGLPHPPVMRIVTHALIGGLIVLILIEEVGMSGPVLLVTATALFAPIPLALTVALGIGGRPLVQDLLAGWQLRSACGEGWLLSTDSFTGRVINVGPFRTTVALEDRLISVANRDVGNAVLSPPEKQDE